MSSRPFAVALRAGLSAARLSGTPRPVPPPTGNAALSTAADPHLIDAMKVLKRELMPPGHTRKARARLDTEKKTPSQEVGLIDRPRAQTVRHMRIQKLVAEALEVVLINQYDLDQSVLAIEAVDVDNDMRGAIVWWSLDTEAAETCPFVQSLAGAGGTAGRGRAQAAQQAHENTSPGVGAWVRPLPMSETEVLVHEWLRANEPRLRRQVYDACRLKAVPKMRFRSDRALAREKILNRYVGTPTAPSRSVQGLFQRRTETKKAF